MAKKNSKDMVQPLEILGVIFALFFMHSVVTNAHNVLVTRGLDIPPSVGPPAIPALVIGLLIVGYYWYRRKTLSILAIIILTIVTVSGYLWIFALRANT
jgi:hypothetical protein